MVFELLGHSTSKHANQDQRRLKQFLHTQVVFVLVVPVILRLLGRFSFASYFISVFIWFLVIANVLAPDTPDVKWWRLVQWVKIIGLGVFCYLVVRNAMLVIQ